MIVREIFARLGFKTDKQSAQEANKSMEGLAKVARRVGQLFIAGTAARGLKALVDSASDAAEEASKFEAVFGDTSGAVANSIEDIAKRTRQSGMELQKYAADIGSLIGPTIGNADATGEMSAKIAEMALDIASFNNLEPDVALQKLRSGLIGSAEPLQSVGVDIREAALGLDEFASSAGKSVKEITPAEKVTLRYNAIIKQLGSQGALGDAQKTAFGFANTTRALGGQLKELTAQIGAFLLPAAQESANAFLSVVIAVKSWIAANDTLIKDGINVVNRTLATLTAILQALTTPLGAVSALVLGIAVAFQAMGAKAIWAWVASTAPMLLFIGLIGAIAAAIVLLIDDFIAMGEGGESVTGTLIGGFSDMIDKIGIVQTVIEALTTAFEFWRDLALDAFRSVASKFETVKALGNFFGIGSGGAEARQTAARQLPQGGQSGGSFQSESKINVNVQASGAGAQDIAGATAAEVRRALSDQNSATIRQIRPRFAQ